MPYQSTDIKIFSLTFDEIEVGKVTEFRHEITKQDVDNFAQLTGDYNPVHVDPDFAKQVGFGKPVVHGMLTSSFISTMIGMLMPGPGALWTSQTLDFLNPAHVGDQIVVSATVLRKSVATKSIVLEISIINQDKIILVRGESVVRLFEVQKKKQ
jgi:3-oxoacyl-[acyl-carrier protein] reductase